MSKRAEKRALELFPVDMQMCIDSTGEPYEVDVNAQRRKYVAFGYEQAEKDLALTKDDVKSLIEIWMNLPDFPQRPLLQIAEETLNIFNEQRNKYKTEL